MTRRLLAICALALAAASCGGGDDAADPTTTAGPTGDVDTVITLVFEDGEPSGDVFRTDADIGDRVRVTVEGDFDEQVHVHGYDLYIEPDAADPTLEFDALIPGRFEIELEQSGRLLLELTVS